MATTHNQKVQFEAAGRMYTLVYSINALCALEAKVGQSISRIFFDLGNIGISTMRTVFWAGLQQHHPEISENEAGRLMEHLGIHPATMLVMQAIVGAFPSADPTAAGDRPLEQASAMHPGTGMVS